MEQLQARHSFTLDLDLARGLSVRGEFDLEVRPSLLLNVDRFEGLREFKSAVPSEAECRAARGGDGIRRASTGSAWVHSRFEFAPMVAGPVVMVPSVATVLEVVVDLAEGSAPRVTLGADAYAVAHYVQGQGRGIWDYRATTLDYKGVRAGVADRVRVGAQLDFRTELQGAPGPAVGVAPYVDATVLNLDRPRGTCGWDYDVNGGVSAEFDGEMTAVSVGWQYEAALEDSRFATPLGRHCPEIVESSPPDRPQFSSVTEDVIVLEWERPVDAKLLGTSYEVVRTRDPDLGQEHVEERIFRDVAGETLTDRGLVSGSTYCYVVRTVDADSGLPSADSAQACETTKAIDLLPPTSPFGLDTRVRSTGVITVG